MFKGCIGTHTIAIYVIYQERFRVTNLAFWKVFCDSSEKLDLDLMFKVCIGTHASVERMHWIVQMANR